jgi:glycosyltransferase involved in cell wall biosynthesis
MKVAFIEGRPHAHPTHKKYADAVNADPYYIDFKFRYHDVPGVPAWKRYISWLLNAFSLSKKDYDVYFSEEAYFMVGLMKWLKLISAKKKIVALMSTHTLYFLSKDRYSQTTKKASIALLKNYDAFICVGNFQKKLLLRLIGENTEIPIYTIYNGVNCKRLERLGQIEPDLNTFNILFLGDIPNKDRIWYKGIDLMLQAFNEVIKRYPQATFTVIGSYDKLAIDKLMDTCSPILKSSVTFVGNTNDIEGYFSRSSLYLHCSRGEAWGISITEAMAAGVVPIISDETGAMEVVEQVDSRLITSLKVSEIVDKIIWYLQLDIVEKKILSAKCKFIVKNNYTEDKAIAHFKETFNRMMQDLKVDTAIN